MRLNRSYIELSAIVIISIVGTYLFSYIAIVILENKLPPSILTLWDRWDTTPYLNIAKEWYTSSTEGEKHLSIVFFPLYPILIKLFAVIFKNYMLSGLIVSNISYAIACFYLFNLMIIDYERADAFRSVIYLSTFPTAYFLHATYTESLFLALTISSFFYARKERWFVSSILCLLATATRITGVLLIPALFIEYLYQKNFNVRNFRKEILWLTLTPLGFVAYLVINYFTFADPIKFLQFQREHWTETMTFPWKGFLGAWYSILWHSPTDGLVLGVFQVIISIIGFFICLYSLLRIRISYSIYMCMSWLTIVTASFWLSLPRFTLSIFPLFISLSLIGKNQVINYLIIFFSLLLFSLLTTLFIQGRWAY